MSYPTPSDPARDWDAAAARLAARAVSDRDPVRWFDELWTAGENDEIDLPWQRTEPMPPVATALDELGDGAGRHAVVVGAGYGADAECAASHGWRTTAFDVSAAAVRVVQARRPDSAVTYRVADLLDLPADLVASADLVLEVYTLQALPPSLRADAAAGLRRLLAPGGELLAVQVARRAQDRPDDGPPWLLDRAEMRAVAAGDVDCVALDTDTTGGRERWVGRYRRR